MTERGLVSLIASLSLIDVKMYYLESELFVSLPNHQMAPLYSRPAAHHHQVKTDADVYISLHFIELFVVLLMLIIEAVQQNQICQDTV